MHPLLWRSSTVVLLFLERNMRAIYIILKTNKHTNITTTIDIDIEFNK